MFEIFTDFHNDSEAIKIINSVCADNESRAKNLAKSIFGTKGLKAVKGLIR